MNLTQFTNITSLTGLWVLNDTLTGNIASSLILFVIFFALIIAMKASKLSISASSFITMILSIIFQSLGSGVNDGITIIFMTIFAISTIYSFITD